MPFQTTFPLDWGKKDQDEFSVTRQSSAQYDAGQLKDHWHDCFEILYITEGSRRFTAGDQSFSLKAGDILVLPPHLPHSSDGGVYRCIVFGYAESVIHTPHNSYSGIRYLLPFRGASALLCRSDVALARLLTHGTELFFSDAPTRSLEMRACIFQIHAILWQHYCKIQYATEKSYGYLGQIQDYIEANLTQSLSPYRIAEALHISHSHLCRIVKAAYRITPAALINRYRLSLSEKLLLQFPDMPISEVSAQAGFDDNSYYIRLFKKENGITPGQFRDNYAGGAFRSAQS